MLDIDYGIDDLPILEGPEHRNYGDGPDPGAGGKPRCQHTRNDRTCSAILVDGWRCPFYLFHQEA